MPVRALSRALSRTVTPTMAGLALFALVAAGCSNSGSDSAPEDSPGTGASEPAGSPGGSDAPTSMPGFYQQALDWRSCTQGECATATVPVDYAKPDGDTTAIALARRPADNPDERLGTLFVNPGGPGASGIDYLATFVSQASPDVLSRYDIVGFDPRGVGTSDPVDCIDDAGLDAWLAADPDPDTPGEVNDLLDSIQSMGKGCEQSAGPLAAHMSTTEVAEDLDVLRGLVGDQKLSYYGASYGTAIGSSYAEQFPKRVGRMVLDGAIDPTLSPRQGAIAQAKGFEVALRSYVEDCVQDSSCPVGNDVDQGIQKISDLLVDIDEQPLDTGDDDRPLTSGLAFYGLVTPLYSEQSWPYLTDALDAAFGGDGSALLAMADVYAGREADGGYASNQLEAQLAVSCLDGRPSVTLSQVQDDVVDQYVKAAPVFGRSLAWSELTCAEWPIKPTQKPPHIDGAGAAPIVVVGTTRDPATPYEQAVALADQLKSGVLLTRDGDGHTGYHMGNSCVDDAIDGYLLDGDVPQDGMRC